MSELKIDAKNVECPLCGGKIELESIDEKVFVTIVKYRCDRCGRFTLTDSYDTKTGKRLPDKIY